MSNKPNSKKDKFLKKKNTEVTQSEIEKKLEYFLTHLSFSFEYYDPSQNAGQDFKDWSHEQLEKLCNKLHNYSKETKEYWLNQSIGDGQKRGKVLVIYGDFPENSDFVCPKHVPDGVRWARFRLEGDMRLIGFIIPPDIAKDLEIAPNVFYIVFLDAYHRFYKTEV